ncbi:MAG: hypothetical protein COU63_04515 [Candidatus Pacebacteria bacterium CG10_big_fil_rev_8_21_14_0_10_36_11]|nr:hypothetical protein [Candidatus Pacearchaeota archaeon]OIP74027.1 MAG: hypothetical protein AUK08_02100 [Candidatus Pacebacteria bacterium CG2_30_36_39]PIR64332.1 MAG: hypothetical protein COU63_04515 [Candidatus Pacebacteria bacterium CG10_big_fil_rev_8_21_14_0_10_36_11]PJC42541.1 MAG: hypothetical protein CO040_03895 [Candidatus Pacebacteria bacterium CG_4_9_14_0_2_um_filter_36_8]
MPGPGVAARQGGGFRSGFGNFNDEHLEEQSMANSSKQHQLTQQTSNSAQTTAGGSALQRADSSQETPIQKQTQPREVGTFKEEAKRALKDVVDEIKGFFSLNDLLKINSGDTPEVKQKKTGILQRFNNLTEEQKQVAQKNFQIEMQKRKAREEEEQKKKNQAAQQKQANIAPPSSPRKGAAGPAGSRKQQATTQLEQDRQTIGKMASAH